MNKYNAFAYRSLLALLGIALAAIAHADQMYVEDELVLNVYADPDQASERVATLQTGDTVESLGQVEDFLLVRLSDNTEGWVAASYLTTEAPAVIRLRELESEQEAASQKAQKTEKQLNEQIEQLKQQNAVLQSEADELKKQAAAALEATPKPAPLPVPEQKAPEEVALKSHGFNTAWIWAPLVLIGSGIGYLLGYQTLARRIRNRFGGVKIY